MAQHKSGKPSAPRKLAQSSTLGKPALKNARLPTVEDRLVAKAGLADHAGASGQQSLGAMSREERRKLLFGE